MRALLAVSVLMTLAAPALAEEAHDATGGDKAEEAEPHHSNDVGVFVGGTMSFGDDAQTRFTIGADYERRIDAVSHRLGLGVLVDAAITSDDTETLVAGYVSYHPIAGLMLLAGAGTVFSGFGDNATFGVRGAAAYFVELSGFGVGPEVSVDRANGETAVVYGVTVGHGF
jgi:hypothetical protein|nr:hypothetical protein [Kofleriaceae bacterium]